MSSLPHMGLFQGCLPGMETGGPCLGRSLGVFLTVSLRVILHPPALPVALSRGWDGGMLARGICPYISPPTLHCSVVTGPLLGVCRHWFLSPNHL